MLQGRITATVALATAACAFLPRLKTNDRCYRSHWSSCFKAAVTGDQKIFITGLYEGASDREEESTSSLSLKLFTEIMENQMDEISLLNSRMKDLNLHRTFLGESTMPGAGRGLFVNCDCRKGDLLTCYPGDGLVFVNGENEDDWELQWGGHVDSPYRSNKLRQDQKGYVVQATEDIGVLGHSQFDKDSAYFGHFCNDGARSIPTCMEELAAYVKESQDTANASLETLCNDSHMVTVATRAIRKGQEVFVSYGPDYWMKHNQFGS